MIPNEPLLLVTKSEPRLASWTLALRSKLASSELASKLTTGASVVVVLVVVLVVVVEVVVGRKHDFPSPSKKSEF